MCFALLAIRQNRDYPFILAANRDEFFQRPAQAMHQWLDVPDIIAGRDEVSQGSWLAMNQRTKRLSLVTNYRSGQPEIDMRSRGDLVRGMVQTEVLEDGLNQLHKEQAQYAGFNLITGSVDDQLYYLSNRWDDGAVAIPDGIHALSNAFLNTPWPKVVRGKDMFTALVQHIPKDLPEALFTLLGDQMGAPDDQLPETGIGLEKERWLSPIFIQGDVYGTRCSTVIVMDRAGRVTCFERSYYQGKISQTVKFEFG